ncbi:MAG: hypothetical protein DWQ01_08905 [Planctomycetota bacterium]|nr:MAG: hypothetical protein DWQ01_08905 [Planctomycetota bacterium]
MLATLLLQVLAQAPVPSDWQNQFLFPESFTAAAGAPLRLALGRRNSGKIEPWEAMAWPKQELRYAFLQVDGQQVNRDRLSPATGSDSWVSLPLLRSGVAQIGMDFQPKDVALSAARWRSFWKLSLNGLEGWAWPHRKPIRLRWQRSHKCLVRATDADGRVGPAAAAQAKSGQWLQIRALADPTVLPKGADLPLRLYMGEVPGGQTRVVVHQPDGSRLLLRPRPGGLAHFRIGQAGLYAIEAHQLAPSSEPGLDGWWFTATLTFEVQG